MLIFKDFSKSYGDHLVLKIPHLTLDAGTYWIRGENGSGKSTLFKTLAGLLPFHGSISFSDNVDLDKHPVEFRKRVNFSEAEPLYPGFLTAKDLVEFVGGTKGASPSDQKSLMTRFGVDQFLNKRCETYSSGMLKKLSIVLGFLGRPQVIILDEPLITLDDAAREVLLSMIAEADAAKDKIILLSSHQSLEWSSKLEIRRTFRIGNRALNEE